MTRKKRISKHVLTGGPCGGKSSGLARLMQKLPEYGITPFAVPELATLLFRSGFDIAEIAKDRKRFFGFEKRMFGIQIVLEDYWEGLALAEPGEQKVLLCDRGLMDIKTFVGKRQFASILKSHRMNLLDARDARYDAVYHLVTAADGAEEFYNLGNAARFETPEEAREQDRKIIDAWNGHEHLRVFGNRDISPEGNRSPVDFETKLARLEKEVCHALGIPQPLEIERWFLLPLDTDPRHFPVSTTFVDIHQRYLAKTKLGFRRRVRTRIHRGHRLYVYTEKKKVRPSVRVQKERLIGEREYEQLLREADTGRREVAKRRFSFVWHNQYFQLDVIFSPMRLVKLEAELTEEQQKLDLPPFIRVLREVTGDDRYSNSSIAAGRCPGYK